MNDIEVNKVADYSLSFEGFPRLTDNHFQRYYTLHETPDRLVLFRTHLFYASPRGVFDTNYQRIVLSKLYENPYWLVHHEPWQNVAFLFPSSYHIFSNYKPLRTCNDPNMVFLSSVFQRTFLVLGWQHLVYSSNTPLANTIISRNHLSKSEIDDLVEGNL
jgi:hypothetical protein